MNSFNHSSNPYPPPSGITLDVHDQIASITLQRPEKRNALTLGMWRSLTTLAAQLDARDDVRAVILTGTGTSFCAGADITEFDELRNDEAQAAAYEEIHEGCCRAFETLGKPVIAAINGFCLGGGCNLALACDFRFAAPLALFAIPAVKLSIVYGVAGTRRLVSQVGPTEAKRMLFTGQRISAAEALDSGLIDEIHDNVFHAALRFADTLTSSAPWSIRGAKTILAGLESATDDYCGQQARAVMRQAARSADYAEARAAFAQRREPRFLGK